MNLIPFQFESQAVRVVDNTWFCAADVCKALGLGNAAAAVAKLDNDEKGISSIDTPGGPQHVITVSESGLYTLILRCRDAMTPGSTAHRFRKWVTSVVLPRIRKTGSYAVPQHFDIPKTMGEALRLAADLSDQNTVLVEKLEEQAPKVHALDRIAASEGSMCLREAAKILQMPPRKFNLFMQLEIKWIFRNEATGRYEAYSRYVKSGDMEQRYTPGRYVPAEGEPDRTYKQPLVTAQGLTKLALIIEQRRRRQEEAARAAFAKLKGDLD